MSRQGIQVEERVPTRTTGLLHRTLNLLMVLKQRNLAERKCHRSGQETILVLVFYLCLPVISPSIGSPSLYHLLGLLPLNPLLSLSCSGSIDRSSVVWRDPMSVLGEGGML